MTRRKLKKGGNCRPKALLGADGAITAAATLAAAGIQAAATAKAAKEQSKAMIDNAKTQADSIKLQTSNNNQLQQQSIDFTRSQNEENRQQQAEIQATLQMLAGKQNMNDVLDSTRMQVALGGGTKVRMNKSTLSYGGARTPFEVTDGGGVIPLQIDNNGYGLYELYGNDHNHYHNAPGGKKKTGVGIKFANGEVIEGEGNQNTSRGEKLLVTPNDAMFISKHSIKISKHSKKRFDPAKAVDKGMDPYQAWLTQEILKEQNGLNDDGTKRNTANYGTNLILNQANMTQYPFNYNGGIIGSAIYSSTPVEGSKVAKYGTRLKLKCGGRRNAAVGTGTNFYKNHAGAIWSGAGNLLGSGIGILGNSIAGRYMIKAYGQAGNILADAYSQMHGISDDAISRENFAAPHTLAVVRDARVNVDPQLERARRNAVSQAKQVRENTLSSAARQQRLAGINDTMYQNMGEIYANQLNREEQIKQENAKSITETANANANRDVEANKQYGQSRLSLLQYNNDIENAKISGAAQARADAMINSAQTIGDLSISSAGMLGSALAATGEGFGNSFNNIRKERLLYNNSLAGKDMEQQINSVISNADTPYGRQTAYNIYQDIKNSDNPKQLDYARRLNEVFGFEKNDRYSLKGKKKALDWIEKNNILNPYTR